MEFACKYVLAEDCSRAVEEVDEDELRRKYVSSWLQHWLISPIDRSYLTSIATIQHGCDPWKRVRLLKCWNLHARHFGHCWRAIFSTSGHGSRFELIRHRFLCGIHILMIVCHTPFFSFWVAAQKLSADRCVLQYMRTGQSFLVVYSINSASSFRSAEAIILQILSLKKMTISELPAVLFGNKADLEVSQASCSRAILCLSSLISQYPIETTSRDHCRSPGTCW